MALVSLNRCILISKIYNKVTMQNPNKTTVSFNLYDFDYEVDDLTALKNISNGEFSKKGSTKLIGPEGRPVKIVSARNMWTIKSDLESEVEVEEHLDRVFAILAPYKESIKALLSNTDAKTMFRCTLYYREFSQGIQLSNKQLDTMAELGAILDLDIYFLGDENGGE